MNLDALQSKAALWAGAGILAVAGGATALAASGAVQDSSPEEPESSVGYISSIQAQIEPQPFEPLLEPEPNGPEPSTDPENGDETGAGEVEALVLGVPEDSPACENNGCGEVENAGGVTLHLPQPAVDGINRAAENRANAGHDEGDEEEPVEPAEEEDGGDKPSEDRVLGVPADSPACEIHGCSEVETPGGVTVNVPQPAADGMARAAENRANAGNKAGDDEGDGDEEPVETASASVGKGKPDWAGPPAGKGPNR